MHNILFAPSNVTLPPYLTPAEHRRTVPQPRLSPTPAGTVCVLGVAGPRGEAAFTRVVQRYSLERRYEPKVFRGSSAGAADFGYLVLRRSNAAA